MPACNEASKPTPVTTCRPPHHSHRGAVGGAARRSAGVLGAASAVGAALAVGAGGAGGVGGRHACGGVAGLALRDPLLLALAGEGLLDLLHGAGWWVSGLRRGCCSRGEGAVSATRRAAAA